MKPTECQNQVQKALDRLNKDQSLNERQKVESWLPGVEGKKAGRSGAIPEWVWSVSFVRRRVPAMDSGDRYTI